MDNFFLDKIHQLKEQNLHRTLKNSDPTSSTHIKQDGKEYVSFCSNDYLNLSHDKLVKKAAIKAIKQYGFGAGASRYVTGNNILYRKLERQLALMKKTGDAIVFGSGYLTSIGVIPALAGKGDLIIADKLIHSSLIDGSKLSGAKFLRFKHNDIEHAEKILRENYNDFEQCLILTETIFSMDGDLGRVKELLELAKKYDALLISDDAHGLGILKKPPKRSNHHLQVGTLSKAVGGYGGYVCASNVIIDYLRNFAKPAIYSTALPPAVLAGNLQALKIIQNDDKLRKKALENANYFCKLTNLPKTQSTIVPIIIGEAEEALKASKKLANKGLLVSAIRPPTVEAGKARLRITFCSNHKKNDIKDLARIVNNFSIESLNSGKKGFNAVKLLKSFSKILYPQDPNL